MRKSSIDIYKIIPLDSMLIFIHLYIVELFSKKELQFLKYVDNIHFFVKSYYHVISYSNIEHEFKNIFN